MIEKRPIIKENPYKIVFVCLGNICRSPTAEGIFQHLVNKADLSSFFYVDSAGTSAYHIGEKADSRSRETAIRRGVELKSRARRFDAFDFNEFDLILAMDRSNYENIIALTSSDKDKSKVIMFRDFEPTESLKGKDVPDPYYGGEKGFENVFDMVERCSTVLLEELKENIKV